MEVNSERRVNSNFFKNGGKKLNSNLLKNSQIYGMILPTIILILLFNIYPILYVGYYSFTDFDGISRPNFIGLHNYARVMADSSWWVTVKNTLEFGIITSLIQIPLALLLAVLLNRKFKGCAFFRAVMFLPNITSTAIMGIIFYFIFASYNGIINSYLINLNIVTKPIEWLGNGTLAKGVVIAFVSWHDIGFYMLLFLAALQKIPNDVYESAKIDGSGIANTFFKITLPMLGRMFQVISMLSIVNTLKLFDSIKALTNGGPASSTEVMTMYIFKYFFESSGANQQGYASALCIVGTLIISVMAAIYLILSKKMSYDE